MITITVFCLLFGIGAAEEKWKGTDDTVVNKFAAEQGREAKEPLINTDQGDLLLFIFLLAGAVGGFAAGYYWKTLLSGGSHNGRPPAGPQKNS
ncbi:MAG: cobalt transporter [Thermodesulfovibrio sp.]|nr:cobalt transporter [Thermodesulfovibrio sp.]